MAGDRQIHVDGLDSYFRGSVERIATELIQSLGDELESITVIGSALTGIYGRVSDINTVRAEIAEDNNRGR